MREVKFRFWDTLTEEMLTVKDVEQAGMNLFVALNQSKFIKAMQYTGLKDINGVEIYEGDVVLNKLNNKIGYIAFLPQEMGYVVVYKNKDERLGHRNTGSDYRFDERLSVVGNIHERPELLT